MTRRLVVTLIVASVVVVAGNFACDKESGSMIGVRSAGACTKHEGIECLPQVGFTDTTGTAWTGERVAGSVVVVNFWATWCRPCKGEIPALTAAYERYKERGLVLLGVMTDAPSPDRFEAFAAGNGLRYPVVRMTDEIFRAFQQPPSIPMTFVYDRAGALRKSHTGPLEPEELALLLEPLLAEPAPAPATTP